MKADLDILFKKKNLLTIEESRNCPNVQIYTCIADLHHRIDRTEKFNQRILENDTTRKILRGFTFWIKLQNTLAH